MRILCVLSSIILTVTVYDCFLRSSGNIREDNIFKHVEYTFRNALKNVGLYPYEVHLYGSAHDDKIET
ncbi:MAG: hypothetical protein WBO36_08230 [Saprospiraceae bacterium]